MVPVSGALREHARGDEDGTLAGAKWTRSLAQPELFMKHRREAAERAPGGTSTPAEGGRYEDLADACVRGRDGTVRSGARRGEPPRRIRCDTPQAANPENTRDGGQICGRSRWIGGVEDGRGD